MTDPHPLVRASVLNGYATLTRPDGGAEHLEAEGNEAIRRLIIDRTSEIAVQLDESVELHTTGDLGEVHFLVSTEGSLEAVIVEDSPASLTEMSRLEQAAESLRVREPIPVPTSSRSTRRAPAPAPSMANPTESVERQIVDDEFATEPPSNGIIEADHVATETPAWPEAVLSVNEAPAPPIPVTRRRSFITPGDGELAEASGWRKLFGLKASPLEQQIAEDRKRVSSHWPHVRRIAVLNGKGGAGKTPTVACISAVCARFGGGGVLAWDNNPTRGTLGWRTEDAPHTATVQDMLRDADALLQPSTPLTALSGYVHHQSDDRYDVLRSNPELLAISQQINEAEFDKLIAVTDRSYRLVVFDSGNDESATRWLRMIDNSHQLIVPTSASPESAESAMLMLEALKERDEHSAQLAQNAVIVVTDGERSAHIQPIASGFIDAGLRTFVIPFDSGLKSGPLRFGRLRPSTQQQWTKVAAAASQGF